MPRVEKSTITQYAATRCEKQLRLSMHPDSGKYKTERAALNLPHQQIRPALRVIQTAGDEWGQQKIHDLQTAFGASNLLGGERELTGQTHPGLRFATSELLQHLQQSVLPGQFLIETEFDADTPTFRGLHGIDNISFADVGGPLEFTRVRPDVIEALQPGQPDVSDRIVSPTGEINDVGPADGRLVLRVIDVKLTSEPGPNYFAELSYYVLALAAFLAEHNLDDRYAVAAYPAVWPGSEQESGLLGATRANADTATRLNAFHDDLEVAPIRIFVSETLRVLRTVIPHVLSTPFEELPWTVTTGCQGCDNLGQKFKPVPGSDPADWDERHCLPRAEREQHLSRLPFLSQGAYRILAERGHGTVPSVAQLDEDDASFDAHHRLRGQRRIVGSRARALSGEPVAPLGDNATSASIPAWAKLRIFITADFDPGSAITLAFGMTWAWLERGYQPQSVGRTRIHHTPSKTIDAEWAALSALLDDIESLLDECRRRDDKAQFQVFVWDTVTFEHLSRVIGRHLARIIDTGRLKRLIWLFPPEEVVGTASLTSTPAVSIVRDAAKTLLSLDLAHTYTLLETARRFHSDEAKYTEFNVTQYWEDPFTDQIPPERAHQVWRRRGGPGAPTEAELLSALERTVRTKLWALNEVTGYLTKELHGSLTREAPRINQLKPPEDLSGVSHLGVLLHAHARLNAALDVIEKSQLRSLPAEEQEAKFVAARLSRRLRGPEAIAALNMLGLPADANRMVFQLSPGSVDVVAKPGEFSWTIVPESLVVKLDHSFKRFSSEAGEGWLADNWPAWEESATKLQKLFGVSIKAIDRQRGLIAVDFESWKQYMVDMRDTLLDAGLVQLEQDLIMEPVPLDTFTAKLRQTVTAIKNPTTAGPDPRIQHALGMTRKPQRKSSTPVEDFLWDAPATAATAVQRGLPAIKSALESRGHLLNDSQWAAWEAALSRRLALIWGPPGTGKTQTLRAVLAGLTADRTRPLKIAVTALTYTAVDNVLEKLAQELSIHDPAVAIRRVRSSGRARPAWLADDESDIDSQDPASRSRLANELRSSSTTTVVGGPPEQLFKVISETARTIGGPVFDVVIIDEAGQLDVGHALLPLAGVRAGAQVIVAGDPKQLPPIHKAEPPAGLEATVGSIYNFFRVEHQIAEHPLLVNYRSNAEIVGLGATAGYPPQLRAHFAGRRIRYADGVLTDQQPPTWPAAIPFTADVHAAADPSLPVVALTYPEGVSGQWNPFEVDLVAQIVTWYAIALTRGVDGEIGGPVDAEYFWTQAVGVVTVHRAQRARVIQRLSEIFLPVATDPRTADWIASAVDTVERFQGQERDIIIATYAVGDPDTVAEEEEFLHNLNRFNVLATRPRAKLIVVASRELVAHLSSDLKTIRSSEMLKDFVDIFCGNQRSTTFEYEADGVRKAVAVDMRWH